EIKISKFANEFNADGKRARVPNAEFVLKDSKGNVLANKLTDSKGNVNFGSHIPGTYTIEEINAPDGYIKSNVYYEVTVDESNKVTYKPKFKTGSGQPVIGEDYWVEKGEETQTTEKPNVTNVSQRLEYYENKVSSWGKRTNVWEAYMFESLKYHADITLSDGTPGKRFEIQFDPNLDFTQYFSGFPKIRKGGKDIADPYFDYNTNLLTYVFNENSKPEQTIVSIDLKGMIPDKYYFQNTGTKPFTITVAPDQSGVNGQTIKKDIVADYGRYDTGWGQPSQSYYFRDIYKADDGQWYVTAMAYFNPMADSRTSKTLQFNWISTNYDKNTMIARQEGKGYKPAYDLVDVKVYRTEPNMGKINDNNDVITVNYNMPLSFGVRPEQDPNTYSLLYHTGINPDQYTSSSANGVSLEYDPSKIKTTGPIHTTFPLKVRMPNISPQKEGFIVEQTFKITDVNNFINLSRIFYMNNGATMEGKGMESAFANSANFNTATADQTGEEIPKYYEEITGLINKKYTPGQFKITKLDQADRTKKLSGAIFVLKPEDGNPIYRTSNVNGEISFTGLAPGRYILEEFKAPDDHIKTNKQWQVFVFNDGNIRITEAGVSGSTQSYDGKNINIEITNKPKGQDFVVYKKDDKGNPLQGAKFKLTKHNDASFKAVEVESDEKGLVKFGQLQNGTYIIEEVSPPSGYKPLDKKWVLVIDDNGKRVYNYREKTTTNNLNSILEKEKVNWVDVGNRSLEGWNLYDNRRADWTANYPTPFKLGTRIVGINTNDKYVIQRYILNPESLNIGATTATIHREKPEYPNMDWYDGKGKANIDYQVFTLDKAGTRSFSFLQGQSRHQG
ncbi:SpaA isopeptide-forming pilin-related protein, partial [uncultured Helcococcus sp.]|uniref:MSCRAMM family protein n=1 Tax=uncultured Helcococcus sp. TaxID=1072508 RepID=UPI002631CD9F